MAMNHQPKKNTTEDLIKEFLAKGGEVTKGKTKPMANELGISNMTWNSKLTKAEKQAKTAPLAELAKNPNKEQHNVHC